MLVLAGLHSAEALRALLSMMGALALTFATWYVALAACGLRSQYGCAREAWAGCHGPGRPPATAGARRGR